VSASYEDFGLTPVEAAAFGRPTAALRSGGFLDTIIEGETGVLFDVPSALCIVDAVRQLSFENWDASRIAEHANCFSEERFARRLREIVAEERAAIR
jgi:glycosyltransferase involved in cell wall biosynthesis